MSYDHFVSSLTTNILIPITAKSVEPLSLKLGKRSAGKIEMIFQEQENQENKRYYN